MSSELRKGYFAAVSFCDEQVGRVLDGLDGEGVSNETVVVFTSDHGYGLGERGHWGKGSLYDIDTRVPFVVRDPSAPSSRRGVSSRAIVELIDLYKSIVDLANLPFGPEMYGWLEGHSIKQLIYDSSARWPRRAALTITAKCPKKHGGGEAPFNCRDRSDKWGKHVSEPLVGFSSRDVRYRYVAWMVLNSTIDAVDWSKPPLLEELYDNAAFDERDLDSSDKANLLASPKKREAVRVTADARLKWLRLSRRGPDARNAF